MSVDIAQQSPLDCSVSEIRNGAFLVEVVIKSSSVHADDCQSESTYTSD